MAFDLSNPLSGLAFEMALRADEQAKKAKSQNEYERDLINKRLTPYGGDISQYENEWQRGYGPAAAQREAYANAMRNYWVGLPEIMSAAAKEGTASSSAGMGSNSQMPSQPGMTISELQEILGITPAGTAGRTGPSADAMAGRADAMARQSESLFRRPTRTGRPIRPQQGR